MTEKILYIMHIDWAWIKQRPHFIAEGLSKNYKVIVVNFRSKKFIFNRLKSNKENLDILPAFRLPLYQNKLVYKLNKIYLKIYFKFLIKKFNPDYIWITFPQLFDYLPTNVNCKIIYDCMDLATGFGFTDYFKKQVLDSEKKLVSKASLILTSSNYLFKKLKENYQCENKLISIRNAYGGSIIKDEVEIKHQKPYKIGYIGTISQWIDFQMLKKSLKQIKNIEYHFIGPNELNSKINNNKFKFHNPIEHKNLYKCVKDLDCLIVPFKIDEKIKSADPGKIYDYINYNKPIVSIFYNELEYFNKFIYFYSNIEEFLVKLNYMIKNGFKKKYNNKERINFLKNNSWDVRIERIIFYLNELN